MDEQKPGRRWWLITAIGLTALWFIGAYLAPTSNVWVALNILTPAGRPNLAAFPFAYPAVGVDGHTLTSLVGLVLALSAAVRWISYLERYTPPPPTPDPLSPSAASCPPSTTAQHRP